MKRVLVGVTVLGTLAILAGCPIYPSNSDGGSFQVCDSDACFDCPDPSYSDACVYWSCNTSQDCPYGYSCGDVATAGSGGLACLAATVEDASLGGGCGGGCPNGYICAIANGGASCIPIGVLPVNDAGVVSNLDASSILLDASVVLSDSSTTGWEDAPFDATSWDAGGTASDGALSSDGAGSSGDGATVFDASSLQIPPAPPGLSGFAFVVNGVTQTPLNCPNNDWVFPPPPAQDGGALCEPVNNSAPPTPPCLGINSVLIFNTGSVPLAYTAQSTWDTGATAYVPGVAFSGQNAVAGVLNPGAYADITSVYVGELTALLGSSLPFSAPDAGKYATDEGTIPWPGGVSGSDGATVMNVAQIDVDTACGLYTNLWR